MLLELRIRNFAIAHALEVRLEPGLNVLTGETGAGKSIVVGALSLLLGERAYADVVRDGAQRAVVEGVFDVTARPEVDTLLAGHGIAVEDGLVILRREVATGGRNRAWVNGAATTAGLVGALGRHLVDLHGQHEHQALLRAEEQRSILDAYAGCTELAAVVQSAHALVRDALGRIEDFDRRRREIEQRADFLRHQVDEIERAAIRPGEEDELAAESSRLEHAEELARLAGELHHELYDAEDAIASRLDSLRRTLEHLIRIDASLEEWRVVLDDSFYAMQELGRRMGEYRAGLEHDPARLETLQRRRDALFRLKTKHGPELEDVIAVGRRAREELDTLDRAQLDRDALDTELGAARAEHRSVCDRLSRARRAAAKRLDAEITATLAELGMQGGRFVTALTPCEPSGAGAEAVEFLVALNAGFEPRPVARVASGGELSRVMLALKASLARVDRVPTLVFDEIDAGIGGRVADEVGKKLKRVAEHHQVFAVTHLARIAARADHHLLVEKSSADDFATAVLTEVEGDARIIELARLLGGDPESAASLEHARELLRSSRTDA